MPDSSPPILEVHRLNVHFRIRARAGWGRPALLHAVRDVSFNLPAGQTLGVVGESGSGKSTLARAILRLIPATSGAVRFGQRDVFALRAGELRDMRRRMQIIFQDPTGSLNPRLTVAELLGEPLVVHGLARRLSATRPRVAALLVRVGLSPDALDRYPHEFSGGQKQRLGLARALGLEPRLLICDEPVSALDVSIQAQILNLLADLRSEFGLSYLFISHNLAVVRHISHAVAVLYLGRIVECAVTEELFARPAHPYTQALLAAVPEPEPVAGRSLLVLPGEVPDPLAPSAGCAFTPRCPFAEQRCRHESPVPLEIDADHWVACHRAAEFRNGLISLYSA